jgi:GNAT superfamily N-acetyltransferase
VNGLVGRFNTPNAENVRLLVHSAIGNLGCSGGLGGAVARWSPGSSTGRLFPRSLADHLVGRRREVASDATERIDAHWSRFLGVPVSALRDPGFVVTEHAELRGYHGVWFFARGRSVVVSAPPEWVARLAKHPAASFAEEPVPRTFAARLLGSAAAEVVGPSFQGWLPPGRFRPVRSEIVRRLQPGESHLVEAFRASCDPGGWEHGGIDPARGGVWACLQGADVIALGQLRPHRGDAVDPCVVTHPDHRGQGHALQLVSALVQEALSSRQLVLYQTLLSNAPAVSIARHLGFERYATLLAVRLLPEAG